MQHESVSKLFFFVFVIFNRSSFWCRFENEKRRSLKKGALKRC